MEGIEFVLVVEVIWVICVALLCDETGQNGKQNADANSAKGNDEEANKPIQIILANQFVRSNLHKC